ncbi:GGDEF domain-containing protein [Halopseudomonas nanhaiensis]|uniref:GGDEF domain-containing protein n=1 Tax=Halopseudomonas nanhaiensis TaxID=2830842 RepID=UPI001CC19A09|nr:GGDEF domain-containing protein [Halopseudomonas nanhaiensis]UAW97652.1 GGDEF domain-containing protein [Halopseudomonas nanhaiensis]
MQPMSELQSGAAVPQPAPTNEPPPMASWRISGWSGEFVDRQIEQEYLFKHRGLIARQLITALLIWAALLLLFAIPDYQALGPVPIFWSSLTVRGATCLLIGALAIFVYRDPIRATQARWITALELIAVLLFMPVYLLRPDIASWIVTLTMIMLIALFIYLPNRVPAVLGVSLFMAAATVVTLDQVRPKSAGEMAAVFLLLLVPIGIGWAAALRTQVLQRKQYAMWRQAQQANEALSREMEERARLQEALVRQATTDPLTGLNNRRQYEALFTTELARAQRKGNALALCIIDLDHFKQVNDTWGHSAGDQVLRSVAQLCRDNFRTIDILGRLGGEEFVVLLPDTDLATATRIAERFIETLSAAPIPVGGQAIQITATAGVVQRRADEAQLESLVQRADKALYEGKHAGRNRVVAG